MSDICRVLVLSGGGSNGAWEMGALWGFLHYGNPEDFTWDVVTGISAGSINAISAMGWEIGDELAMTEWGSDLWLNLTTPDIYRMWPDGIRDALNNQRGLFDNTPLREYLNNLLATFDGEFKRRISIGTVDANTGDYWLFN